MTTPTACNVAKRLLAASSNSKKRRKKHNVEKIHYSDLLISSVESDVSDDNRETEYHDLKDNLAEDKRKDQLVTEKVKFNEINIVFLLI